MPDNLSHAQRQERKDDIEEAVRKVLKEILPELFQQELGKAIWADMRPARTREQIRDYLQEALEEHEAKLRRNATAKAKVVEAFGDLFKTAIMHVVSSIVVGLGIWQFVIHTFAVKQ